MPRSGVAVDALGREGPWIATSALEVVRVTEVAAIASARLMGRGDEEVADQAAVDAMRRAFDALHIRGHRGHRRGRARRGAHALHRREGRPAGDADDPEVDIALDPLEGTNLCAYGRPGAISRRRHRRARATCSTRPTRTWRRSPWARAAKGAIDMSKSPDARTCAPSPRRRAATWSDLTVVILDRPRHEELIKEVRAAGARIRLIEDGDVAGGHRHLLRGDRRRRADGHRRRARGRHRRGGHPLRGRRHAGPARAAQRRRRSSAPRQMGITDIERIYTAEELAQGDVMFAATGVTTGDFLKRRALLRRRRARRTRSSCAPRPHRPLHQIAAQVRAQAPLRVVFPAWSGCGGDGLLSARAGGNGGALERLGESLPEGARVAALDDALRALEAQVAASLQRDRDDYTDVRASGAAAGRRPRAARPRGAAGAGATLIARTAARPACSWRGRRFRTRRAAPRMPPAQPVPPARRRWPRTPLCPCRCARRATSPGTCCARRAGRSCRACPPWRGWRWAGGSAQTFTDSELSATLHGWGIGSGPRHAVHGETLRAMRFWLPLLAAALSSYAGSRLGALIETRYSPAEDAVVPGEELR